MKFRVSSKVKGSLILKSVGRAVQTGAAVHIEGNALYADDIQRAIKSGLLVADSPEEKIEVQKNIINKTSEAVIVNKTDRVVIVGNFPIRPHGSTIKDISELDMNAIKSAIEKDFIQVIVDVDEELFEIKQPHKKVSKPIENEKNKDELTKFIEEVENKKEIIEKEPNSFVWDFKTQKTVKPQVVPKAMQKFVDEDKKEEEVDMVDAKDDTAEYEEGEVENAVLFDRTLDDSEVKEIAKITAKIEKLKRQLSQKTKKKSKKKIKKKGKDPVKAKDIKMKSDDNVTIALDSMGRPLKEDMSYMIGEDEKEDISFVDMEQAQKNIDIAKKRNSGINIDLGLD